MKPDQRETANVNLAFGCSRTRLMQTSRSCARSLILVRVGEHRICCQSAPFARRNCCCLFSSMKALHCALMRRILDQMCSTPFVGSPSELLRVSQREALLPASTCPLHQPTDASRSKSQLNRPRAAGSRSTPQADRPRGQSGKGEICRYSVVRRPPRRFSRIEEKAIPPLRGARRS